MQMKEASHTRVAGQLSEQELKNDSKEPATVIFGNS
ncbi:hypothetical protein bAD24_III01520 [Burkholderia sp. AD24]|uniref:Uncharacterized protein n=1 Tax=Paraburkholderia bryophila TaxID=420952 RepID=A0A7Y9WTL1_9BURK|nr:hypothetical protein bAD24_III01520 [Burkholderia sp. AD24]NYH14698.1 hypothetical protein [Paraburkholderia bryophila]NYH26980.1 hypothetical protein [Paraburkholderia bryophila]PQV49967.1 hypothetical protein B0G83_106256 [Paraburkholderia sp. BL21I4N1]